MSKIIEKREKMCKTLNDFLDRNKDYAIEIYLRSTDTDFIMGRFLVPTERNHDHSDMRWYRLSWDGSNNDLKIPCEEILACYEETDEYGSCTVRVIMKCGIMIDFECCGARI